MLVIVLMLGQGVRLGLGGLVSFSVGMLLSGRLVEGGVIMILMARCSAACVGGLGAEGALAAILERYLDLELLVEGTYLVLGGLFEEVLET
jgi:hypothetical protein